jgi:carbonic anhydrase
VIRKALVEIAPDEKSTIEDMKFGEIVGSYVYHGAVPDGYSADAMSSVEDSIKEDVALLRALPLIREDTRIVGLKFDIETGLLSKVESG